jgi:hypothetical protein
MEVAWTIVHTASTLYNRYITETVRLFLMMWTLLIVGMIADHQN